VDAVKISIVIPAYNEEKLLPGTLAGLRAAAQAFTERGWAHEVVVCDNNSRDGTAALARAAGARVVFEPVNQISRARNAGAAAASGEWLVFVDADSSPCAGLLGAVADEIGRGRTLAGGSTIRLEGPYPLAKLITRGWNWLSRLQGWAAGSFIFCEAAAFRAVGGFSERLYASEEIELFQRLKRHARRAGRRIVILHRHPMLTSERKLHLYTPWEHARFLARTVLRGGRTLRRREDCGTWYDGRR
jgi:glycosyltransferase involved in cell wall biosynthesis